MRTRWKIAACLTVAVALSCSGCDEETGNNTNSNAANNGSNNANNDSNDANNSNNANNGSNANNGTNAGGDAWDPDQTREEYCMGSGPPVIVGDDGGSTTGVCTGDIAQATFRFAVCVCEDYGSSGSLTTDSFDSSMGPYDPNNAGIGGAVGINGRYDSSGTANIGGSLWVGSAQGISSGGPMSVANELRTNGNITSSEQISVDRDAYVAGNVAVQNLAVGGSLFTPNGTDVTTQGQVDVVRQDVGEITPCDCEDPLDVEAVVALNQMYNHNEDVGLDPAVFSSFNTDVDLDLDCGRFYLDEIEGSGNATINVAGRTAIFIGGDVSTSGELTFNVAPGAVVDVFIAGDFSAAAAYVIGDVDRPASARFYSGGDRVSFSQSGIVAGNFYAPYANMTFSAPLEVYGSVFARRIDFSDSLTVHYDEAILTAGEECAGTGDGFGGDGEMCVQPDDCRGGVCGAEDTCIGDGGGAGGDVCAEDGDCAGGRTCGADDTCSSTGGGGGGDPLMCTDCRDCGNQACNDGECGACSNSLDCCSPLICYQGECILVIE